MTSVLLTGATSGLGWATTHVLAGQGHAVVAVARNEERAARLVESVARTHPSAPPVEWVPGTLDSLASVNAAGTLLRQRSEPPQCLVFNAGVQVVDGIQYSEDGYELTMATNVLAHFLLFRLLQDKLRPGARVITLGSETHRGGPTAWGFPGARWQDPKDLFRPPAGTSTSAQAGRIRYATSKLASIYLAYEIDRRFGPRDIHACAFDPALMPRTGLARGYPSAVRKIYAAVAPLLERLPEAAAVSSSSENLAWLATAEEAAALHGEYVTGRRPRRSSAASYDGAQAEALWDYCALATEHVVDGADAGS